ncbi:UDP-N-acetylmuramate dehydrogenase [Pedobacter psychroterrae]|uniref:UDP-N-acetylenolpyruvoylglucosamine reductase n=1 Tax=Pedobacter psychroterrae TaxID=2530453 RepID=A0A4R0NS20_9SPHI|nr:UDP-N-acetylmuramate dehydrogenase [Pedobacter psychroterrae]TCD02683.1 UDP-N-acetylmuramate dehydrogenase [Pedobacter psychroterrae]
MKIVSDLDLTPYNSYRIPAICKRAFFPESEAEIQQIFQEYPETKKIIIGSGHNIIFSRDRYEDDFIIFSGNFEKVVCEDDKISAESGVSMLDLSNIALSYSLSGLELFYDIPSSLGGAIVMNAGASGEDIQSLLLTVRYYDPQADVFKEVERKGLDFEYRNSFFQQNPHLIITHAFLQLRHGDKQEIGDKMENNKKLRWAKQPKEFPNAGSVFKRPKGHFVGVMMEEMGLKGYTIGGARISEKHGGFIVNFDNATGKDILEIITLVKKRVLETYSLDIEVEQRII